MTTPDYETTLTAPLTTDDLVQKRVEALIGRACRRQLWFLFLDDQNVQLPLLIPVGDPPSRPYATVANLARLMKEAMVDAGGTSIVVVLERYLDSTLTPADKEWARSLHSAFDAADITLRAILVSHRRGVRWLALEDYRI